MSNKKKDKPIEGKSDIGIQEFNQPARIYAEDVKVKPVIRTQYNNPILPRHYEKILTPSNTVPDQSMPLKTIIDRFVRGLPLDIPLKNDMYEGENEEYIDMRNLDLADQQELLELSRAQTAALEQRLKDQAKARKDLQIKKLRDDQAKLRDDYQRAKDALSQIYPKKTPPEGPPAGPAERSENQH